MSQSEERSALEAEHTPEAIRDRLKAPDRSYLRDFIYGAIDGAVTTFAIVCGVAGAKMPAGVVIVLGVANLVADGISMAASNYLGTRAEQGVRRRARREEEHHIAEIPEGEREEIRQIFARKGFEGDDLDRAVDIITSDVTRWVDTMLQEERGLPLHGPSPLRAAVSTFVAFVVIGALPLLAYVINAIVPDLIPAPFVVSAALTGVAFLVVGALKGRELGEPHLPAALETLLVGGLAAVTAYGIGAMLRGLA